MNKMTVSPLQNDYVTKQEFNDFKEEMREFKAQVNWRFDQLRRDMINDMRDLREAIIRDFQHHMAILREQVREDIKVAMEYVQNIDDKKVDKRDFEELKAEVQRRFFSQKTG